MANQKFLDLDGLGFVLAQLKERGYQGYGLSQENFTPELKEKYDNIAGGVQPEAITNAEIEALLADSGA